MVHIILRNASILNGFEQQEQSKISHYHWA
jgi:hypothetical protein